MRRPARKQKALDREKSARRFTRKYLTALLAGWQPVHCQPPALTADAPSAETGVEILRGERLVCSFALADLRAQLTPEQFELVALLYDLLLEQACVAHMAVDLARIELAVDEGRRRPKPRAADVSAGIAAFAAALESKGKLRGAAGLHRELQLKGAPGSLSQVKRVLATRTGS